MTCQLCGDLLVFLSTLLVICGPHTEKLKSNVHGILCTTVLLYFKKYILSCCLRYSPEYFVLVGKTI